MGLFQGRNYNSNIWKFASGINDKIAQICLGLKWLKLENAVEFHVKPNFPREVRSKCAMLQLS